VSVNSDSVDDISSDQINHPTYTFLFSNIIEESTVTEFHMASFESKVKVFQTLDKLIGQRDKENILILKSHDNGQKYVGV